MAKRNKTFSEFDILRIISHHLTEFERDYVICTILVSTGFLGSPKNAKQTLKLIKSLSNLPTGILDVVKDLVEAITGEQRYNPDT